MLPCTEVLAVRITPQERLLIESFAQARGLAVSELLRELIGLEPVDEPVLPRSRHLRLVTDCEGEVESLSPSRWAAGAT